MQSAAGFGHDGRSGSSPSLSGLDVLHTAANFLRPRALNILAGEIAHALHDLLDEADARAGWQLEDFFFQSANRHESNKAEATASGKWGNALVCWHFCLEVAQFTVLNEEMHRGHSKPVIRA
jgi:hypothetical protein